MALRWTGVALLVLLGCRREEPSSLGSLLTARTMGLVHLQRDELIEAEADFRTLIRLAPSEPLGYANLGIVYLRLGRLAEAEREIRRALVRDSSNPDILLTLAKVQESGESRTGARETLEHLLRRDPANSRALYALAELGGAAPGERSDEYWLRLGDLLPGNPVVRLRLAEAMARQGKPDDALQQLEALRQLRPEPPAEAADQLEQAIRFFRSGSLDQAGAALSRLHRMLELTPGYRPGSRL